MCFCCMLLRRRVTRVTRQSASAPPNIGIKADLNSGSLAPQMVLFGENASRILLSCDRNKTATIKQMAVKFGLSAEKIGETAGETLAISVDGQQVLSASVLELKQAWSSALEVALHTEAPERLAPEVLQKS